MEINTIELAAATYMGLFGGLSLGNVLVYNYSRGRAFYILSFKGEETARGLADATLEKMAKKGWFYNNVFQLGTRLAYEKFLKEISSQLD